MPSLCIHTPPLFQVELELENTTGSRWTSFGVRVPRTLDYPTINLNPQYIDDIACTSHTDRQTDEHNGNSTTIRSTERITR